MCRATTAIRKSCRIVRDGYTLSYAMYSVTYAHMCTTWSVVYTFPHCVHLIASVWILRMFYYNTFIVYLALSPCSSYVMPMIHTRFAQTLSFAIVFLTSILCSLYVSTHQSNGTKNDSSLQINLTMFFLCGRHVYI